VQYVLEGSLQRSKDRLRVTAQLVDAIDGKYLWAEKYDRILEDIFTLQDEITMKIITVLQVELTAGETALLFAKRTTNLEAYIKAWQANECRRKATKEDNARARQLVEEAIVLDPKYSGAYAGLGWTHVLDARFGWSKSREESMEKAMERAEKAIRFDPLTSASTFYWLGMGHWVMGQYEEALAAYRKALNLSPTAEHLHIVLTATYSLLDREEKAHAEAAELRRLDPGFSVDRIAKTLPFKDKVYTERYVNALRKAGLK
jgi:adenylate cyclase